MKSFRDDKFSLVFHIGAGKTGTSSVQRSLREARTFLRSRGYDYWGLMLEHAPIVKYEWQKPSVRKEFISLSPEVAAGQVADLLAASIDQSKSDGIRTAIWSHEWFFNKGDYVIPALKALEEQGVEVRIVVYVRRHDSWARSAYIQWGIKHKTYKGPIKPFNVFIAERPVGFSGAIRKWRQEFPRTLVLRNFDAADDVVRDFVAALGLPQEIPSTRVNETPDDEELFLRALFNNTIRGEALPMEFDRHFKPGKLEEAGNPIEWMLSLLPDDEDLAQVRANSVDDRDILNEWLVSAGQPPLEEGPIHRKPLALDKDKLLRRLIAITTRQSLRIRQLQRQLQEQDSPD